MAPQLPVGVFAVQCPKCRKYMLVEEHERNDVRCLLCKTPIRVAAPPPPPVRGAQPPRP
jgi:ribosomal protein S27E